MSSHLVGNFWRAFSGVAYFYKNFFFSIDASIWLKWYMGNDNLQNIVQTPLHPEKSL